MNDVKSENKSSENVFPKFQINCIPQELQEVYAALTLLKKEKWKILNVISKKNTKRHDTTGGFFDGKRAATVINGISDLLDQACYYIEKSAQKEIKPGQEEKFYNILGLIHSYPNFKKSRSDEVENALETLRIHVLRNGEKEPQGECFLQLSANYSYFDRN